MSCVIIATCPLCVSGGCVSTHNYVNEECTERANSLASVMSICHMSNGCTLTTSQWVAQCVHMQSQVMNYIHKLN